MKKIIIILLAASFVLLLAGSYSGVSAQMANYCQTPPTISLVAQPNVLLVIDASGSMGWEAYSYGDTDANSDGYLDKYNPAVGYEGYFRPDRYYKLVGGIYEETVSTGLPCTCTCTRWSCSRTNTGGCDPRGSHGCASNRYACCTGQTCTGDCNIESGNYLNYAKMNRVDLVRWAMTGGTPASCTGTATFNNGQCDPELWNEPGNATKVGAVCNDSLDVNGDGVADGGCILLLDNGDRVKVPWSRVRDALVYQFKQLPVLPRLAAMFYSGNTVRAQKVYMGDFTAPNSTADNYPFMNLITHVNSHQPSGGTPTGPAMWDALNYFSQKAAQYGGFPPQSGSGDRWKNPVYICDGGGSNCKSVPCANNFVLLMSDGQWNSPSCSIDTASADPVKPAYEMHMGFANTMGTASTSDDVDTSVSGVYTIGLFLAGSGQLSMKNVAMYGSFANASQTWPGDRSGFPAATCTANDCSGTAKGSSCTALPPSSADWDRDSDGVPDTFFKADSALEIKQAIMDTIMAMLKTVSSGTAASVLASAEGSGANLIQGTFYPYRVFDRGVCLVTTTTDCVKDADCPVGETCEKEVAWAGSLQNLWYFLDAYLGNSSIREDTLENGTLQLLEDDMVSFRFDAAKKRTMAGLYRTDGRGDMTGKDTSRTSADLSVAAGDVYLEELRNLWEVGEKLHGRNLASDSRKIYTQTSGNLIDFASLNTNDATIRGYLQAADKAEADKIIAYTVGADQPGYRKRLVSYKGTINPWRLGDVVSSTPRLVSWVQLNNYDRDYEDGTYAEFLESDLYKYRGRVVNNTIFGRGMVFAGANDGMLHAINLGAYELVNDPALADTRARLRGTDKGREEWSFIPKNVLPYLKYIGDPNYCHIYSVDLTPFIFDASIGLPGSGDVSNNVRDVNSWRTILIGGMRLGGACRDKTSTCTDCVKTPVSNIGFSSYFALDITDNLRDPSQPPKLLWEFSDQTLGFSTTGPAIARINVRKPKASGGTEPDKTKNGKWFVVFASGPTGPIDLSTHQFKAYSDQPLKLFVLDLKTGGLQTTLSTGLNYAFGGSLYNATMDYDLDYQDDVLYFGYVQSEHSTPGTSTRWTNGGVLRLSTNKDDDSLVPSRWIVSPVLPNVGAVTAGVGHTAFRPEGESSPTKGYLFFGTGRYYYKDPSGSDDLSSQRLLVGMLDPCVTGIGFDSLCTTSRTLSDLDNVTTDVDATEAHLSIAKGWYIKLEGPSNLQLSGAGESNVTATGERVITDPLVTPSGAVFFTTFMPTDDICSSGGKTFLWGLVYDRGSSAYAAQSGGPKGTALLQVSTGEVKQLDLKELFRGGPTGKGEKFARYISDFAPPRVEEYGRRSGANEIPGVPPTVQGLTILIAPRPIETFLHIRKK